MNNESSFAGLQNLFGDNYHVCGITEEEENLIIEIKSHGHKGVCPGCGETSTSFHATYTRGIQDTPIRNRQTWLHVTAHKYDCLNPECAVKVFTESLPFAGRGQVRTHELTLMALGAATNLGNETASRILSGIGIKMSNDTLTRIYKGLDFEDDPFVEEIGIDDVSNRKGQTYYTVIYDLQTHRLLAMLEGRDGGPLKEWLRAHTKVRLVARDRASAYASAVSEILPDAVQVADRFHLIQNILDWAKDIVNAELPKEVFFAGGAVLDNAPKKVASGPEVDVALLSQMQYDNAPPVGADGLEIQFDSKNRDPDSRQYKAQAESRRVKQQRIRDMQQYNEAHLGTSHKELAARFGVSEHTAKKYLSMAAQEIEAMDYPQVYKKRETAMGNYIYIIFKMLLDNVATELIYAYVCQCGYSGNPLTLLSYIEQVKKTISLNVPRRTQCKWYNGTTQKASRP
jgi:hypothetical protein